jgi:hypothetical protein
MQIQSFVLVKKPARNFVYTACDTDYFRDFARPLIHSVKRHTDFDIHFHLFNPLCDDLEFCEKQHGMTYSYETISRDQFATATDKWNHLLDDTKRKNLERTINAMNKGRDHDLQHRMQKTYYACVRFMRLAEIFDPQYQTFAMDVDSLINAALVSPGHRHAFYIHRILGPKSRYLAGGIWLNADPSSKKFLQHYALSMQDYFDQDYIYWGIDQDVLEDLVPKYDHGLLPMDYIDWEMQASSLVWTAKGARKTNARFLAAKTQYC